MLKVTLKVRQWVLVPLYSLLAIEFPGQRQRYNHPDFGYFPSLHSHGFKVSPSSLSSTFSFAYCLHPLKKRGYIDLDVSHPRNPPRLNQG